MRKGQGTTAPLWRTVSPERRDSVFRTIEYLALRGFHAWKIADVTGVTVSQVYIACQKLRIRLRDYRDGRTAPARAIIKVAPVILRSVKRA